MRNRKDELGNGSIGKLLLKYSAPATFGMLVNSLYNLVDAIFIGHGAGILALGGLAISFPIQMIIIAVSTAVGIGSASIISRSLGAGKDDVAFKTAGNSFFVISSFAIACTVLGLLYLEPLLRLFGATEAILPYGYDYMSVILLGSYFQFFSISTNNLVRAEGNAKVAMLSMVIGAGINIILDPIFIFGFGMGIKGAAIATVIARFCAVAYLIAYFASGKSLLKYRLKDMIPDFAIIAEILKIGSASFTRVMAGSLLAIIVNNSIAYYGSDLHLAILGVCNRLLILTLMPLFGSVQGLLPIIGFNYGAENMSRVKHALKLGIYVTTIISVASFLLLIVFPQPLIMMFSTDEGMINEGSLILRALVLLYPLIGFQIVGASLFQAIGKAFPALLLSMSRQILFLIPFVLVLPLFFGLWGVWLSFPTADLLATMVTLFWVMKEVKILRTHERRQVIEPA